MFSLINNVIHQLDTYLVTIGLIWCLVILVDITTKLWRAIRVFILPRVIPPDLTFYGKWAIVTGGSAGIGKSYAHQLARRGMNIVIISNELEALKSVAEKIEFEYGVQCCYIHADFTKGVEVFDRVMNELGDKDVGILVNGAGIPGEFPCYFLEESEDNVLAMIDLHVGSVVNMTLKILPLMLAKNKGVMVNISSMASLFPQVLHSVYSSCKAFSDRFTRALYWEYIENNNSYMRFQSLTPSLVSTRAVSSIQLPAFLRILVIDCDAFTASAAGTITVTNHTTGYWIQELTWFCSKFFPIIFRKSNFLMYERKRKIK